MPASSSKPSIVKVIFILLLFIAVGLVAGFFAKSKFLGRDLEFLQNEAKDLKNALNFQRAQKNRIPSAQNLNSVLNTLKRLEAQQNQSIQSGQDSALTEETVKLLEYTDLEQSVSALGIMMEKNGLQVLEMSAGSIDSTVNISMRSIAGLGNFHEIYGALKEMETLSNLIINSVSVTNANEDGELSLKLIYTFATHSLE